MIARAKLRKKTHAFVRSAIGHIRYPKAMSCLDCGFLAIADVETSRSDRILLACNGEAGCPPLDELHCTKSLWVDYDLSYFSVTNAEALFDELKKQRRPCQGFVRYRPGSSPNEHKALEEGKRERREKIMNWLVGGVGGVILTLLSKWLLKHLGLGLP